MATPTNRSLPRWRSDRSARITPAEIRVLKGICRGGSNRTIAANLRLSPRTVESHVSSLLEKTGCHNRTQLLLWALENDTSSCILPETPA
ncbi:MAG: response regulator transcription factor [Synechococcaceae cyanobacterium]